MSEYIAYARNNDNGTVTNLGRFEKDYDAVNATMKHLFNEVGNGGMSAQRNTGDKSIGSLWRCADEIYDCLINKSTYSYCEFEWWIEEEVKKDEEYVFMFSAVVYNDVHITAKSYDEAVKEYNEMKSSFTEDLKENVLKTSTGWNYDCNINDEGDQKLS